MEEIKEIFLVRVLIAIIILMMGSSIVQAQDPLVLESQRDVSKEDPYCGETGYVASVLKASDDKCSSVDVGSDSIPDDVVGWVLVELRTVEKKAGVDVATTATVIARKPAFLISTGRVLDAEQYAGETQICTTKPENCPPIQFDITDDLSGKDIYAVVRHLNHLDIISDIALTTSTEAVNRYKYDFTEDSNSARGGTLAQKKVRIDGVDKNVMVMYVGDVNGDTNINAADYLEIRGGTPAAASDINFDGSVNEVDANHNNLRANFGRSSQLP